MQIHNIIPDFLSLVESKEDLTVVDLETYFERYPAIFADYFPNHCPKTEERLSAAIEKYPKKMDDIQSISVRLLALTLIWGKGLFRSIARS
ncbi:hypothetical protein [Sporosarcina limicola]|uniref:Uncharacterized protein n=1 Tax=Sporosarcina limicola TaxID=34101 RepID=A0A927R2R7_9BACL|nr:hypothetical protein [Sporosarcina limicola]MBE1552933.1 hypothetical protein [Sporosarcina limicola]